MADKKSTKKVGGWPTQLNYAKKSNIKCGKGMK